ncbi:MAG: hypothetical protein ACREJB_15930, partial [Planctomycetaceae bacterium]
MIKRAEGDSGNGILSRAIRKDFLEAVRDASLKRQRRTVLDGSLKRQRRRERFLEPSSLAGASGFN